MQNKFEKQVQQKMDELRLTPSEPVWQNIASQIRKKREGKPGMLIWFSLFGLLLGGVVWLLVANGKKISYESGLDRQGITAQPALHKDVNADAVSASPLTENRPEEIHQSVMHRSSQWPKGSVSDGLAGGGLRPGRMADDRSNTSVIKASIVNRATKPLRQRYDQTVSGSGLISANARKEILVDAKNTAAPRAQTISERFSSFPVQTSLPSVNADKSRHLLYLEQGLNQIMAEKTARIKTRKNSKWQKGLELTAGVSGASNGLNLFQQTNPTVSPNQSLVIPFARVLNNHPVAKQGLALGAGFSMKKVLTKRVMLATGLGYRYYSTFYLTGSSLSQGTMVFNTWAQNQYTRSPVNSGTVPATSILPGSNNGLPASVYYRNNFHFLSLPIAIDYSLFTRIPLRLQAGVSVQQLVATNALVSDPNTGIFYKSDAAFNRTNLFATFGFTYSLKKLRMPLQITPHLDYGILKLTKNGAGNHLIFAGLTTGFNF